jgi:hypothetical protein
MSPALLIFGLLLPSLIAALGVALGAWISFQLIQQNGRLLARLEGLAQQFGQLAPALVETPAAAPERRCKCGKPQSECGRGDCDCARRRAQAANGG